jgi:HD-GYP domain-containing protein (c-di-GMP phosphodiesterase class II)
VDVYDALTTSRPYRPAFSHQAALAEIANSRAWWSERVYTAFLTSLAQPRATEAGALGV